MFRPTDRLKPLIVATLLAVAAEGSSADPAPDTASAAPPAPSKFRDPEDGQFDVSGFLDRPFGFIPTIVPITEPAVGAGVAAVPLFVNRPEGKGRPDIWGLGGMATSNGSRGFFGGYSGYFFDQRLKLLTGAAKASINLDFYGLGQTLEIDGQPLRYNLDGTGSLLGVDWRLDRSDWWVGLRYLYADIDASFVRHRDRDRVTELDFAERFRDPGFEYTISTLQPTLTFDSRDNIFTPTSGFYSELSVSLNTEALGGGSDYQIVNLTAIGYQPLVKNSLFLGLRGDWSQSFGEVPFYLRPSVQLRGAPLNRYQGDGVAYTEAELRWQFEPRWSLVGFGGAGFTWTGEEPFNRSDSTFTGGGGFRYLIARRYGLHMGIDVAYGGEGPAVYVQFGSGWFRP